MKLFAMRSLMRATTAVALSLLAAGCANMSTGVGISFPVGPFGSIGVGVGSDGRVGASVGVGVGPATVSVGTSGTLRKADAESKTDSTIEAEKDKKSAQ